MTDSLFDLSGRVALVTGTSRGLGQYFARALARAGADIAMTSRDKQSLSAFADEIGRWGGNFFRRARRPRLQQHPERCRRHRSALRPNRYPRQQCGLQYSQTGC